MNNKLLNFIIAFAVFFSVFFVLSPKESHAAAEHNIRGWADSPWGYISFNCLDDGFAGHFPFTFPFTFNMAPCLDNQHGVHLDFNNNFSGQAWNSLLGDISLESSLTPPDENFRNLCNNGGTCTAANNCIACYNEVDEGVYGYMYVEGTGDWIRLDSPTSVSLSNYEAVTPGIFRGYASASSTTLTGSVKFSCLDEGVCETNNYQVKIGPLEIRQMIAPNWSPGEACSLGQSNNAILRWNRRSGMQSAYQVIVSTSNSTTTDIVYNSGKVPNTIQNPVKQVSFTTAYNTSYYWFLKLWDENDVATDWRQFNTQGTKDWVTDNWDWNLVHSPEPYKTFTSYKHEFPKPFFTWEPEEIVAATTTNSFLSSSYYYDNSNIYTACNDASCSYLWTTSDPEDNILSPMTASTSINFARVSNNTIRLRATDTDGYSCATSTILDINYALPLWKEVKSSTQN